MKMGRELEALDALLQGLAVYDTVNADAEAYEVTAEVDEIKSTICSILETNIIWTRRRQEHCLAMKIR